MSLINIPLDAQTLGDAIPGLTVLKYGELCQLGELPLPLIVLYETQKNYGHWVAVLKTPEGIEHFDPYGIVPDNELKWIDPRFRKASGQDVKCLLKSLYNTKKTINYNTHRLQGRDSSTCGRWAILRILFSHLGNDAFARMIRAVSKKLQIIPDELVTIAVPL